MVRKTTLLVLSVFSVTALAQEPSIGTSKAIVFEMVSSEKIWDSASEYLFACAASKAKTKEERAQTIVKAILALEEDFPAIKIALHLAAEKSLCQEGRLIGTGYYSPDGSGWKELLGVGGSWKWNILTTDVQVTEQQISDTVLYENKKPEFKKKYGVYDYSDKLDAYIENQLGRRPSYIASGLWVDTYFVE
ncbi:MAG: DUF4875 domain-containing protein [bacterium]